MTGVGLIVFAGGQATRLGGVNKALLDVGGQPIVGRILEILGPLVEERLALTNDASLGTVPGLRLVHDAQPHAGVLPALANGLAAATSPLCLAVACDMPFVSRPVFERLLAIQATEDADVVIPRTGRHLEPMHAVYRREPVLAAVRAALARGQQRMVDYFPLVRLREVPDDDLAGLDPGGLAFFNVNTPEDLAEARQYAAER